MAWRCHPRGLWRTPGWPKGGQGNQGRILEEKKTYFQGVSQYENVVETQQIVWFAHILCFAFWRPFGTRFGVHFGPFWEPFGTLGAPWGLQVALQGSSEGAQRVA